MLSLSSFFETAVEKTMSPQIPFSSCFGKGDKKAPEQLLWVSFVGQTANVLLFSKDIY